MKSFLVESFFDRWRTLPAQVQDQARKAHRLWRQDHHHPSLRFKRVHPTEPLYSVRISRDYRVLGLVIDDTIHWFWIGSHADYEKEVKRFS